MTVGIVETGFVGVAVLKVGNVPALVVKGVVIGAIEVAIVVIGVLLLTKKLTKNEIRPLEPMWARSQT